MSRFWHWPDKIIRKRESRRLRDEHNKLAQEHADMLAALEWAERITRFGPDSGSDLHASMITAIARAHGEG